MKDTLSSSAVPITSLGASSTMRVLKAGTLLASPSRSPSNHRTAACGFRCAGQLARRKEFGPSMWRFARNDQRARCLDRLISINERLLSLAAYTPAVVSDYDMVALRFFQGTLRKTGVRDRVGRGVRIRCRWSRIF